MLANRVHRPNPVADVDEPQAALYVRDWEDGPDTAIPRHAWGFARKSTDGVVPSHEHIYLAGGFEPGKIYTVVYTAASAPVVGSTLLAVREAAVWLRHPSDLNPIAEGDEATTDPYSGQSDGLLSRLRALQAVPKIIYTNSSAEYWRGDGSLTHINASGAADLEPAAESRDYHFAGTQHVVAGMQGRNDHRLTGS